MGRFRRFRHLAQLVALRSSLAAARWIPRRPRRVLFGWVARAVGSLAFEARARANLKTAFGGELTSSMRRKIRRANAVAAGRMASELVDFLRDPIETAREYVLVDPSIRFLDEALAIGRGTILLTPHFGNWEMIPAFIRGRGYTGAVIARRPRNALLARELIALRKRAGAASIDSRGAPRAALRVLAAGGILGVLPDLDTKHVTGEFLPFFGKPAFTATGPAALALLARAPLITAYLIPEGDRYRLVFEEPIIPDRDAPRREETLRLTRAWSTRFEARIRAHPDLWVWIHDRWSTTPEQLVKRKQRRLARAAAALSSRTR